MEPRGRPVLESALNRESTHFKANKDAWVALVREFKESLEKVRQGAGPRPWSASTKRAASPPGSG
jgi:3-methylcrotonyl-CoA carboxylase beta subunit